MDKEVLATSKMNAGGKRRSAPRFSLVLNVQVKFFTKHITFNIYIYIYSFVYNVLFLNVFTIVVGMSILLLIIM